MVDTPAGAPPPAADPPSARRTRLPGSPLRTTNVPLATNQTVIRVEGVVHAWLVRNSIPALRISMGLIFLGFGILKFFPGVSPAENLVEATIKAMTDGMMPGRVGVIITAVLECVIGVSLITGRGLRAIVYLLVGELIGILSPLVLLPGRMFGGPHHAPTLEGQYVLKDITLVAAAMVVATQFRGAKITTPDEWDLQTHSLPSETEDQSSDSAFSRGADTPPLDADRGRTLGASTR